MSKDFDKCPHCIASGKSGNIVLLDSKTPLISRSDGQTYHLYLFSGPDDWPARSGAPVAGRVVATFFYASEILKIEHEQVIVVVRCPDLDHDQIVTALRDAADLIAQVISTGQRLEPGLFYDRGYIRVLRAEDRP